MNNLDIDKLCTSLINEGWYYESNAIDLKFIKNLKEEMQTLDLKDATIGRNKSLSTEIRSDKIHWLEKSESVIITNQYLDFINSLKKQLNEKLYLGLNGFEGHYAQYDKGSFYKAHMDNFKGGNKRVVTIITYLNENWQEGDGGELRIYKESGESLDIQPIAGGTIVFMSGEILHEVLMAHKSRQAITGWLLR